MQKIETAHGIFTENTSTGQNAQQVYEDWLITKDLPPQPSKAEILEQQIATNTDYLIDMDYRVLMIELGLL